MSDPATEDIPDELLRRWHGASLRLVAWLENRNRRPTLLQIEEERKRRGIR